MNDWRGVALERLPFFRQQAVNDCGVACLRMVAAYYGVVYLPRLAQQRALFTPRGISIAALCVEATAISLQSSARRGSFAEFLAGAGFPCIVYWQARHFVVAAGHDAHSIGIADPASGKQRIDHQTFCEQWLPADGDEGIVILFQKTSPHWVAAV